MQLASARQLTQDGHDAACAVHVFNVVLLRIGRHLAQLGHHARETVDVGHREVNLGLFGNRQQVQDGVGGAAHGDIQRDGILKRLKAHRAWQHAVVVVLVVIAGQLDNAAPCCQEQLFAVRVRRHHRAVAGQGQAQRLGQAVHGVGSEHARA